MSFPNGFSLISVRAKNMRTRHALCQKDTLHHQIELQMISNVRTTKRVPMNRLSLTHFFQREGDLEGLTPA
jgi:hypothetical protein